jgi:hypothetical protein
MAPIGLAHRRFSSSHIQRACRAASCSHSGQVEPVGKCQPASALIGTRLNLLQELCLARRVRFSLRRGHQSASRTNWRSCTDGLRTIGTTSTGIVRIARINLFFGCTRAGHLILSTSIRGDVVSRVPIPKQPGFPSAVVEGAPWLPSTMNCSWSTYGLRPTLTNPPRCWKGRSRPAIAIARRGGSSGCCSPRHIIA